MPIQGSTSLTAPKFSRRQSYDVLSTTKAPLSLGPLPLPNFSEIPNGQRSVPVSTTSTPRLTSGGVASHRNVFGPSSAGIIEAPRTPGGSLVIGSEVFGFGRQQSNLLGKERWGSGTLDGESTLEGEEGFDQQTPKGGETDNIKWSNDYTGGVNGGVANGGGDFQLDHSNNEFNVETSNPDFQHFSRPSIQSFGSSGDIKTSSHSSSQRPTASRTQSSITLQTASSTTSPQSATGLDLNPIPSSTVASQRIYPSNGLPETSPYLNQGYGRPTQGYGLDGPNFLQPSAEDLAIGLGNINLRNDNGIRGNGNRRNGNGNGNGNYRTDFNPYAPRDSISMSRQTSNGSTHYNPYYNHQQAPNFIPQQLQYDPYTGMPYVDSPPFFNPPPLPDLSLLSNGGVPGVGIAGGVGVNNNARRDSGYASSSAHYDSRTSPHLLRRPSISLSSNSNWNPNGQQVQPIALSDYAPSSSQNSRHGSFSFSPNMSQQSLGSYGSSPGTGTGANNSGILTSSAQFPSSSGGAAGGAGGGHLSNNPSFGSGRGGRNDYIAPGPSLYDNHSSSNYGGGNYSGNGGYGGRGHEEGNNRYSDDLARVMRSPILEEFRISRHKSWELYEIAGHVVEFAGDQLGSRHIQTKLETASSEEKNFVFEEILPNMLQLSTDVFANYVIQKFFEQGSQAQKTAMAKVLEGHVLQLSLQMYGCRVVQKALEYVLLEQQVRLIQELDGHILQCSRDAQSNHVVQRALERVPSEKLTFITDACKGQVHSLATHPYGCRVLQRIFENCHPSQTEPLLEELHLYTQTLIQDQYGNYVIQWIVEKGEPKDRSQVIAKISGQVLPLAQQKFASNVIEKCVIHATSEERHALIEEVLLDVRDMICHPYGNYVMQKILFTSVGAQREAVVDQIRIQLANLRKMNSFPHSKHLIAIEKLLTTERARTY